MDLPQSSVSTKVPPKNFLMPAILSVFGIGLLVGGLYVAYHGLPEVKMAQMIKACVAKSGVLTKSYPPQCILPTPTASPAPSGTDFQTYTYSENKFSFEYPSDWKESNKLDYEIVSLRQNDASKSYFRISLLPNNLPSPRNCWKQVNTGQVKIGNSTAQKTIFQINTNYGGDDSYLCGSGTQTELPEITQIIFRNTGKQYSLIYKYPVSQNQNAQQTLDHILTTFKFY